MFLCTQSDELAAAKVFEEFKASFEDAGKGGKTFVRGQTINPDEPGINTCYYLYIYTTLAPQIKVNQRDIYIRYIQLPWQRDISRCHGN